MTVRRRRKRRGETREEETRTTEKKKDKNCKLGVFAEHRISLFYRGEFES